ncbi:MAG: bifunctional [glutamine synthetase] adenylyltransferase/[glutamine synthetase]-adenylyl-L-tyrosine phosphorylase [Hyphomicrobiales bacterium]|nr:bifunctional [glutamine synthetase] adenylyltransferase/[glutamine synthetase]-adenylyl-L-tyrosine phosphorylase [Hyphomicrobiales bacterium]MCY4038531.1 bifunctional [glutamine synthetase] adenylyltransferase/[glutamine synthetase]-adenylyl-L-tyrosine phosphorylase [Hyphomicrobiales bacterium]
MLTTTQIEANNKTSSIPDESGTGAEASAPGRCLPPLFPKRAEDRLGEIIQAEPPLADVLESTQTRELVLSILGASPFLWRIASAEPQSLADFLRAADKPETERLFRVLLKEARNALDSTERNQLMVRLREIRRRVALLVALADMRNIWSLEEVTDALSRFADAVIETSLSWLLNDAFNRNELTESIKAQNCALTIIGMGKYGSRELNYSSDIDIIALFEPGKAPLAEHVDEKNFFIRITRDLAAILTTPTSLGHVFRVDLRLRPDAGSSAVAISIPAAESYYESIGRNWERAAFIKASTGGGDKDLGIDFIKAMRPFVWRKYLDANTIRDIHAMKEQTHALKRARDAASGQGYDIKRGAGGIRAIEFFVQAQQLIAGGKDESLRSRTTCGGLAALLRSGWIDSETANKLSRQYHFLRMLEHRLQMVNDEQTHALPRSAEEMDSLARFSGYENGTELWRDVSGRLDEVERLVSGLFSKKAGKKDKLPELVFPALEDDPPTLKKLHSMGFVDAEKISGIVREWSHGNMPVAASEHNRNLLAKLLPEILKAAADNIEPDASIANFNTLLRALPAEVQLLSLFDTNPKILTFLMQICSSAPRLANYLERNVSAIDSIINPDELPDANKLLESFNIRLKSVNSFDAKLGAVRERVYEERFRLGMQLLASRLSPRRAGQHYADLGCAVIRTLESVVVEQETQVLREKSSSENINAEMPTVVAMGKLGSGEMSPESDLDIIIIHDSDNDDSGWFQRITQKLIKALSIPTVGGKLFSVDMRLRPFGASGSIVTSLERFREYQRDHAWTWEHMALTRALPLTGPERAQNRMGDAINEVLCRRRNPALLAADVVDMRERIKKENPSTDPWELKHASGGFIDMEFISQYIQLAHAYDTPQVLVRNNRDAFKRFAELGVLGESEGNLLKRHWDLLHALTHALQICIEGKIQTDTIPKEFHQLLARAGQVESFDELNRKLADSQKQVHDLFEKIIVAAK